MDNKQEALMFAWNLLDVPDQITQPSGNEQFEALTSHIDILINKDFNRLLSILYRVDVSEEKIKKALAENKNNQTAGKIIGKLLIERQEQKLKSRAQYRNKRS